METYVVRVWLPDRPGALGQVASRIGAVRGDVTGIDILERGGGRAVDELVISMPDGSDMGLLVSEIGQVDGVAVEDVRRVPEDRPDHALSALETSARLVECEPAKRIELLCSDLLTLVEGDWAVALDSDRTDAVATLGAPPDSMWLAAFLAGSSHLAQAEQAAGAPGDLVWTRLVRRELVVVVGRAGRPFHTRERQLVDALGRVCDLLG
jgi:hypothetical protein